MIRVATVLLAGAAALLLGTGTAHASITCSPTMNHGGEHAPQFTNGGINVYGPVQGGYNCNKNYTVGTVYQYESGGQWFEAQDFNNNPLVAVHPSSGYYTANTGHLWTEPSKQPWIGQGLFNACHYNWRFQVQISPGDGSSGTADVSPELFNTC